MFDKKNWKDRVSQFPARRTLTNVATSESAIYSVSRAEGTITEEGDSFSAQTMNDLENRILSECNKLEQAFATQQTTSSASTAFAVGAYLIYNGDFYRVIRAINAGDALTVGSNITKTSVGAELRSLANSINSTSASVTALSNSVNNTLTSVLQSINNIYTSLGSVYRKGFIKRFEYVNISGGFIELTVGDCSSVLSSRAYGVTVTAGGNIVFAGSLTESRRTNVKVAIRCVNNAAYSGTINELTVIVWGE